MRTLIILIALLGCYQVHGQRFEISQNFSLPDSIQSSLVDVTDFDNDGLLDVIILATTENDLHYILFVKGDTVNAPVILTTTIAISNFVSYKLTDYDYDNDIDIILFGSPSQILLNSGNFLFLKEALELPTLTKSIFIDLNNDGKKEIVANTKIDGDMFLVLLQQTQTNTWESMSYTAKLDIKSIEAFDANLDGYTDIFVSGRYDVDSLFTGFLMNDGNNELTNTDGYEWLGTSSSGDLNGDGFFDVSFSGRDNNGHHINRLLLSKDGTYIVKDSILQLSEANTFIADFDADGRSDIQVIGKNSLGENFNLIQTNGTYDTLLVENIIQQKFADIDRDGDLDVIQLCQPGSLELAIIRNNASANNGPLPPSKGWGIPVFDRFFLYWDVASDDHTVSSSLTYDVTLEGSSTLQMGEFDLLNERRLRVSHGNAGTQNFKLYKNLSSTPASFAIQAIDNSFTTFLGNKGLCINSDASICSEFEKQRIQACTNEQVMLSSPVQSVWFSFSQGFLGLKDSHEFLAQEPDTLFYFDPTAVGCAVLKIFVLEIVNTTKKEFYTRYACQNETIKFGVETGWESVAWNSLLGGDLGSQDSIDYLVTTPDSLFVTVQNDLGCAISRRTAIRISKPVLVVPEDEFIILKGQEVQLSVSGGVRWQWIPEDRLSNTGIAHPIASPIVTTHYIVVGYDSLDCSAQASIKIVVEDTGFVPSLFTPNGDGKNDALKIYGLSTTSTFTFSIHNREGKLMYEASNVQQVTQQGWDGTRNGLQQPPGVYFWKVTGSMASGEEVRLNGKTEGSIVLVR
jgi:gliding motility-associated-like protein